MKATDLETAVKGKAAASTRGAEKALEKASGQTRGGPESEAAKKLTGKKREREEEEEEEDVDEKVYDEESGALSRRFETFRSKKGVRGFGKTRDLDDHPWLKPQIMLVCGPTGCGKTSLVLNILDEVMEHVNEKRLGKVMFYTGSRGDKLLENIDEESVQIYGPKQTESLLQDIRDLNDEADSDGEEEHDAAGSAKAKLHILVLDDVINNKTLSPNNAKGSEIGDALLSHRHMGLMIVMLGQKWNGFPTYARDNVSHWIIFGCKNEADIKKIMEGVPLPKDQVEKEFKRMADPHEFLWVDIPHRTVKKSFGRVVLE